MCEKKKINICDENENLVENLDLDRCERYLQINMMKRSISRAEQKQKQSDIDFANVCCFKLLEFELFEFLLIGAFWLAANSEAENHWRRRQTTTKKTNLFRLNSKSIDSCFSILHVICSRIVVRNRFISWCWLQRCKESNAYILRSF